MKIRLSHVCNSSSSDFIATTQACICYGKGDEDLPNSIKVPLNEDLERLKEGDVVTLDRPMFGWTRDYKLIKISSDIESGDGLMIYFFFQELDSNGVPLCQE